MLLLLSEKGSKSPTGYCAFWQFFTSFDDKTARKGIYTCITYQTMLICMNITVRDLNEEVFRRFKGKAAERGLKMGAAVTRAMQLFIAQEARKPGRKAGTIRLSDLTKGDSTSEEIDSLLYGK